MYEDEQLVLATYKVTWNATYDNINPKGNTDSVACSNGPHGLAGTYPHFKNFPDLPYLGGAYDTRWGSSNCGKCWKLTSKKMGRWIYFTAIDATGSGFNIGKKAFIERWNGGGRHIESGGYTSCWLFLWLQNKFIVHVASSISVRTASGRFVADVVY
jgi:hypothetical protein